MYRKSFDTLIDISKGITAGLFVAAVVSVIVQEKESGFVLFGGFLAGLIFSLTAAILYDRRYNRD